MPLREQRLTRPAPRQGWAPKWIHTLGKRYPTTQNFISRVPDFHAWDSKTHGQNMKLQHIPTSLRGKFFYDLGQNRVPKLLKADAVTRWGKVGKGLSVVGAAISGSVVGHKQWEQDSLDPTMRTVEKVGRTTTVGLAFSGGPWGGAA